MITDNDLLFADGETTGNTGTRIVGDVVDLKQVRDIGAGTPIYLVVRVETGITVASSTGTYQVALTSGTDASLTSPQNHVLSDAFATSTTAIPAGTVLLNVALPLEGPEYKRFVGIREIVASQNTNAGAISAFLTMTPYAYKSYPQGTVEV